MKITLLGAAGMRSPLLVQALLERADRWGLESLALMDIDGERLDLLTRLTRGLERRAPGVKILRTTDSLKALQGADIVLTVFRVGGPAGRVIDERIPLALGVLGQETTGAGGFAMAMRTIPVLFEYLGQMRRACPKAWLVNFANPSGLLTQAITGEAGWGQAVGICDAPEQMRSVAAQLLGVAADAVDLDYVGLNHLGWVRRALVGGADVLPRFLDGLRWGGQLPGMPIAGEILLAMGMVPNEYLYYYYHAREAVEHLRAAGRTRGEAVAELTDELFAFLRSSPPDTPVDALQAAYRRLLASRGASYMTLETGERPNGGGASGAAAADPAEAEGYASVALDLIEALRAPEPRRMILNLPNRGALPGMADDDVVEIPGLASAGGIVPCPCDPPPAHALALMRVVKAFERLTIEAALERSYDKALLALVTHPLVGDAAIARRILDGYIEAHGELFPSLVRSTPARR
jgi:6-phospho-beta-glucosidase